MSITLNGHRYHNIAHVRLPGISRCEGKRVHGWLARVYLSGKPPLADLFSDSKYGGDWEASLQAAFDWVEKTRAQYPPPLPRLPFQPKLIRSNTTGFPGLCFTWTTARSGKRERCYSFCLQERGERSVFRWRVSDYRTKAAAHDEATGFILVTRQEQLRKFRTRCGPEMWKRIIEKHGADLQRFWNEDENG